MFFSKNPSLCKARNLVPRALIDFVDKRSGYKITRRVKRRAGVKFLPEGCNPHTRALCFYTRWRSFVWRLLAFYTKAKIWLRADHLTFETRISSGDRNFSQHTTVYFFFNIIRHERYSFQCSFLFPLKSVCRISSSESLRFQLKTVQSFNNHSGYSIFQFENDVNFVKRDKNFTSLFGSTRKMGLNVKWVVFSSTTWRSFLLLTETFSTGDKFVSSKSSYSSGTVVQLSKRWEMLFTRDVLTDWKRSLQRRFETRTLGNLRFALDLVLYLETAGSLCASLTKQQ